ncbi:MAG TPA: response regulator [Burkholderiales bacterium]|nr:response regulator [Burkholderiales bacterium]
MESPQDLRVLVVEDNHDVAEMLRNLLATWGFTVEVAHTSQEGIEAARQLAPHVVLCDIGLPDGDGYMVGSVLRQSDPTTGSRLIAVTGHGEPIDRQRALAAGFDQHFAKPVNTDLLLREISAAY